MDRMSIYVISLYDDHARRQEMEARFDYMYDRFKIIEGVRLCEKHQISYQYGQYQYDRTLTAAELGCALSHVRALEAFLRSSADHALILEDDVLGTAEDILDIATMISQLPSDSFLLCGGQEGLRGEPYNYGRPTSIDGVFQVPDIAKKFFTRACCYCVTRRSALQIVQTQRNYMSLSDNWAKYFKGWSNFFFARKISHPVDLTTSNIEHARRANTPKGFLSRVIRDGVSNSFERSLSKRYLRSCHRRLGLVRIN